MMRALSLAVLLAFCGCNTPSIPLPPPELSALSFVVPQSGYIALKGAPIAKHIGARFYVFDRTSGDGAIQDAASDGSFETAPFKGGGSDAVEFWLEMQAERSASWFCTLNQSMLDPSQCNP